MRRVLESEVGVTWQDAPLRNSLANLANGQNFAILLDRRVDPDRKLTFSAKDERLEKLMLRLAEGQGLGFSAIANVLYLGPPKTAQRLATIAALRRGDVLQASTLASKLSAKNEVRWKMLAQPRELVTSTAAAYGLKVTNPELIPHDLWAEAHWPAMGFADRMTLLLAGFDLTFTLEPKQQQVTIIPWPNATTMESIHTYNGEMAKAAAEIKRLFPDIAVQSQGKQLRVVAPFEIQEKVNRLLSGESVRTTKTGPVEKRYTLNVDNQPAGAVIATVAKELSKEAKFSDEVRAKLAQKVAFQAKDVTLGELLVKTLEPLKLRANVTDTAIEVVPAE